MIKMMNKSEAEISYREYFETKSIKILSEEYSAVREEMLKIFNKYKSFKTYEFDYRFAVDFYIYVNNHKLFKGLTMNHDFWRYICVEVAPDIIEYRHPITDPDIPATQEYYFGKNLRMYFPTMYWYVNLSWQDNREDTLKALEMNSTDTIMQLVERPGKKGLNIDLFRRIMYYYYHVDKKKLTVGE